MEEFFRAFSDSLEIDESVSIEENTLLQALEEWDSLGRFSFLSLAFSDYDASLDPDAVNCAATVGDLWRLVRPNESREG